MISGVRDIDYLIIGQGLAGSLLAWELLRRGQRVVVIDDPAADASTRVAAGLINAVGGPRLSLTVRTDELLPAAHELFRELEQTLGQRLLFPRPLLRLFQSEKECRAFDKRFADPAYAGLFGEVYAPEQVGHGLRAPFGGVEIRGTGNVATVPLLEALGQWLREREAWQAGHPDPAALQIQPDGVRLGALKAQRVIFCEGQAGRHNPWFSHLPLNPLKGQILTLRIDAPMPEAIISAGHWLLPLGEGRYRLGATYERRRDDTRTDVTARQSLTSWLGEWFIEPPPFEVEAHEAGVRPAVADRLPLLGLHPAQSRLGIFNGFGSKGSLMIPWYAARFVEHLLDDTPLPAEADIRRFEGG